MTEQEEKLKASRRQVDRGSVIHGFYDCRCIFLFVTSPYLARYSLGRQEALQIPSTPSLNHLKRSTELQSQCCHEIWSRRKRLLESFDISTRVSVKLLVRVVSLENEMNNLGTSNRQRSELKLSNEVFRIWLKE